MQQRRSPQQIATLAERLEQEAKNLRRQARGTPAGVWRDDLLRKARQAETASASIVGRSPSLQQPRGKNIFETCEAASTPLGVTQTR